MSSIIVLDSSDEDESPPKKANLKHNNESGNTSATKEASSMKTPNSKPRSIPSSITVTPRPVTSGAKTSNSNTMQSLTSPMAANINQVISNILNQERQTPTPPNKGQQTGNMMYNQRKRKTPTPPQHHHGMPSPRLTAKPFSTMANISSPAKAATTIAPLPPIMPLITGVHSMAQAGATPPLQLMATPPHHNLGGLMGLNEQLMMNPHLLNNANLPPNTTITAHPNLNFNHNNINNNFKIHLPLKPPSTTTPSPAASPKTPSPQLANSPQPAGGRMDKSRRIIPTTLIKSSDESWQQQRHKSQQRTPISLNNDVVIEMLPPSTTESPKSLSASSSRHHTPMTSPTTIPKSLKSPDVILVTPHSNDDEPGTILDLTRSPDKLSTTEIVDLVNTPSRKHINGDDNKTTTPKTNKTSSVTNSSSGKTPETKPEKPPPKPPLEPEYEELIKVCRAADPSADMKKLIKSKLLKYYYEVHGDFVKSKSFRKSILKVVESIKAEPDLVYYNLKTIVEELKVRRKAKIVEDPEQITVLPIKEEIPEIPTTTQHENTATNTTTAAASSKDAANAAQATKSSTSSSSINATASTSTGNKKLDEQIKKLNKALYVLTKRIEVLEEAEVDWDDDDSSFLQVERFKKRACQIYEKICDLTGESKNAHRLVKKPIKFNETRIPQFNKTLQAFINRTKEFPDYYDVLRMLEHCNRTYSLGLVNFEIKNIAEEAFIKVGKLLQKRRKADLYETVTHYGGNAKDPAKTDPSLAAKLNENLKSNKKISEILEKFARKQDMPDVEEEEKSENSQNAENENSTPERETTTPEVKAEKDEAEKVETEKEETPTTTAADNLKKTETENKETIKRETELKQEFKKEPPKVIEEDYDDDDDDEDEEDEENLDEHVETLANGDVSDNESDNDIIETKEEKKTAKDLILDKSQETPNIAINTTENECVEITDKINKISENEINLTLEKSFEVLDKPIDISNDNKNSTMECIEINDTQEEIMEIDNSQDGDVMETDEIQLINKVDVNNPIIQIDSQADNLCMNNNNNIEATTKTVINTTGDDISEVRSRNSPPPTPPSNGNHNELTPFQLNNTLSTSLESSLTCTAATTTTTTKADLKIVHVSSLDQHDNHHLPSVINRIDENSSLCTDLTSPITKKSLDEIVISDEES